MSIGHVMTMFNEQQEAAEEPTTETSEEKDEASSSPLDQYINEHKTNNESDLKSIRN
jgi:hypothetical protein